MLHPWQITAAVNSPADIAKQHFTAAETGMQTSMRPSRKMCLSPQHLQSQKLVLRKLQQAFQKNLDNDVEQQLVPSPPSSI